MKRWIATACLILLAILVLMSPGGFRDLQVRRAAATLLVLPTLFAFGAAGRWVFFPLLGAAAGLAASYLFSPSLMGMRLLSFGEWLARSGEIPHAAQTIAACMAVGILAGLGVGLVSQRRRLTVALTV